VGDDVIQTCGPMTFQPQLFNPRRDVLKATRCSLAQQPLFHSAAVHHDIEDHPTSLQARLGSQNMKRHS